MSSALPPLDCSLNFSEILDFYLKHEDPSVAYSFGDGEGKITNISRFEFARAAHRVAHLLRPRREGSEGQVLAIIALTDFLVYHTLVAGCVKAGILPFPISHRNSAAAVMHLLQDTGSHRLLTTKGSLSTLLAELSTGSLSYKLSIEEIPLLGQMYPHLGHESPNEAFTPYPTPSTRAGADERVMYLHSSGSTGFPKSIPSTHRTLIHFGRLDSLVDSAEISPRLAVGALPPFHALGMATGLLFALITGGTACVYPLVSTATEYRIPAAPTADNAILHARNAQATGIVAVPALILDWHPSEAQVAYLKTLAVLGYSGGPLAERVGDSLVEQGVNVVPLYGATEFGLVTRVKRPNSAGWSWLAFSKRVDVRWMPQGDGSWEAQFLTNRETHQVTVENLPDAKGYSSKDLFERHPTKPDLFRIVGRLDDVLIMANGEKTVPGPMEDIMMASPLIRGAVMFGRERNHIGVLVEPNTQYTVDPKDESQLAEFRNLFWPVVEEANALAPAFARIYKEMILVTHPDKPMARAAKSTVIKKATLKLYDEEIAAIYNTIEASVEPPPSWSAADLEVWLATHATLLAGRDIQSNRDLFDQGFDSLNATFLRHHIVGALKNSGDNAKAQKIPQNIVYMHPSIEDLARALAQLVNDDVTDSGGGAQALVEAMIAKYSQGLDTPIDQKTDSSTGAVVLLTGTTGGLGSHILEMLLRSDLVERVYAFNRPGHSSISERQVDAFVDRGLDGSLLLSAKLVFLEGDASKGDLGLAVDVLDKVRDTVTVIIHNAWMLDFNKTLSSFESHVKGTRNLIDLARSAARGVRFLFTSSISSAQGWDPTRGPVPEELQIDSSEAIGTGYGESKYVSERILAASGLEATSFRIGQVCGAMSNGAWSTTDWVPSLVKSSIALGDFPSDPTALVAWLPAEAVSGTIVDVALSERTPPFAINIVHPRPVPWDLVMSSLADIAQCPMIPFAEWVKKIQERAVQPTAADLENIPGIKLLGFFTGVLHGGMNARFATDKAQEVSEKMRLLEPLNEVDARRWMGYWKAKKFI